VDLNKQLNSSIFNKDPQIISVKRELEALTNFDFQDDAELNKILNKWQKAPFERAEFMESLPKSQKDILLLSVEGIKAKEIANMLNLSYSHVRNTRSQLLKIIQNQGFHDFADLKA
jgi:DNA-binding NarL/FixJ family response regulator